MIEYKQLRHLIHQKSLIVRNPDLHLHEITIFMFLPLSYSLVFLPITLILIFDSDSVWPVEYSIFLICIIFLQCCSPFVLLFFLLVAVKAHPAHYEPQRNCPCHQWDRCKLERHIEWLHSAWRKLMIRVHSFCPLLFGNRVVKTVSIPAETLSDIVRFIPSINAPRLWTTSSLFSTHFVELHNELKVRLHGPDREELINQIEQIKKDKDEQITKLKRKNKNLTEKNKMFKQRLESRKSSIVPEGEGGDIPHEEDTENNQPPVDPEDEGGQGPQPQPSLWQRAKAFLGIRLPRVGPVPVGAMSVIFFLGVVGAAIMGKPVYSEELSSGMNTGINFDKYEEIPVEATDGVDFPPPVQSFSDSHLNLHPWLEENIRKCGYNRPTPVQEYSILTLNVRRDLMSCAQTGSGKTAAFLVPLINSSMLISAKTVDRGVRSTQYPVALIISPTRELSLQIYNETRKFAYCTPITTALLYGGRENYRDQINKLWLGCHILIATPGRLIDVMQNGYIGLDACRHLVLDEADRMLDMGFEPQIRQIVEMSNMPLKGERVTAMFSATFPKEIQILAQDFLMADYVFLAVGRVGSTSENIRQNVVCVDEHNKRHLLMDLLDASEQDTLMMDKTVSGKALNTTDLAVASQRCTNSMSLSSLSSSQIQSSPKSSLPTASTPSFIKASFCYSQAKQRREGERDDPPKMHNGSEGLPEEAEEPGKEQEKSATTTSSP